MPRKAKKDAEVHNAPESDVNRGEQLGRRGADLVRALEQKFSMQVAHEAIECNRQAIELCSVGHPYCSIYLSNLSKAVIMRYEKTGVLQDVEDAIDYNRQVLELPPSENLERSWSFSNLANAILTRFQQIGNPNDLNEAIDCNRRAIELCPTNSRYRGSYLSNLSKSIVMRFERTGVREDLDEAIDCNRKALDLRPPGHPDRSWSLSNLASAILTRFQKAGDIRDLNEAVDCNLQAVALCPLEDQYRSAYLCNLSKAVIVRFEQTGALQDLNQAIEYNQQALELRPPGHPDRSWSLSNLANAILTRFQQAGALQDLDEAIACNRQAVDLSPPGHPYRSSFISNLAKVIFMRFEQMEVMQDLNDAIDYNRQALEIRLPGHPDRSWSLSNIASALLTRFKHTDNVHDLDEAIACNREATELCSAEHPQRSAYLRNLASGLIARFSMNGITKNLDDAVDYLRQSLELRPPGHPERGSVLMSLAAATRLYKNADLDVAVNYLLKAQNSYLDLHPLQARVKWILAEVYLEQLTLGRPVTQSFDAVFELLEASAVHRPAKLIDRIAVANRWASLAREYEHHSCVRAYTIALQVFTQISVTTPTLEIQHNSLRSGVLDRYKSLASDAASSAIAQGNPEIAITFLEQGRAILWSRMRGYRQPLETLKDVDGDLAGRFERLSVQLELHSTQGLDKTKAPAGSHNYAEEQQRQYRILSEKWDQAVEEIRALDGFEDFLRPAPFSSLRAAAAEGPVIVVNVNRYRSDAIIICAVGPPIVVRLWNALPKALARLTPTFKDPRAATVDGFSRAMIPVLQKLWRYVVEPIAEKLTELGYPRRSRIWWCPTSELCALPIHAAGPYTAGEINLPDRYVSSYTPTLSALKEARSNSSTVAKTPGFLIIAPLDDDLATVEEEVSRIQRFGNFDTLLGPMASSSKVIDHFQRNAWVHFACHGHRNEAPLHSSFQLHADERLELLDIMKAQLPNAELAFLSACHGAAVDHMAPEESVNLATALQFCGFRSVVGTLWSMADEDGPQIAEAFYRYMFRNPGNADFRDAATALNLATREMRKKDGMTLGRWVNFIHIGA